jgi:hypothetical protein
MDDPDAQQIQAGNSIDKGRLNCIVRQSDEKGLRWLECHSLDIAWLFGLSSSQSAVSSWIGGSDVNERDPGT